MKNLRSFYNKFKIKDLLYFVLILPISITLISNGACADKLEKSNTIIQEMISKAKVNAIETLKSDQNEKSLRISLLIKEYINLNFMARRPLVLSGKKQQFFKGRDTKMPYSKK